MAAQKKVYPGFTAKFNADNLVWFEETSSVEAVIQREK